MIVLQFISLWMALCAFSVGASRSSDSSRADITNIYYLLSDDREREKLSIGEFRELMREFDRACEEVISSAPSGSPSSES